MKILYKNRKAEEQFNPLYKGKWTYPKQVILKLIDTANLIESIDTFYDISMYPAFHLEKLKGNRKDEWGIRLGNTGYRVTLIPCDEKGILLIDGDILARCKTIKIIMITEASNSYE